MRTFKTALFSLLLIRMKPLAVFLICVLLVKVAAADVFNLPAGQTSLQFVPVGDSGNANDPASGGLLGGVAYNYSIGKFNVTVGQYVVFLNSVAATDTYALYNQNMATRANIAGIAQNGSSGNFTYSAIGSLNQPIAYASWADAARFANWLTNDQPTGAQAAGTTETGSYNLNGAMSDAALNAVTRNANATYVIPTENEWYKAAYYDPTKGGSNYWLYPMRTDSIPDSAAPPGVGAPNAAHTGNFFRNDGIANGFDNGYAVTGSTNFASSQNYLTDVGAYLGASSHYGTFDQGGDLSSWDETIINGTLRGIRGGSWVGSEGSFRSTAQTGSPPSFGDVAFGFRVALVPEPSAFVLAALGVWGLGVAGRKKYRRA